MWKKYFSADFHSFWILFDIRSIGWFKSQSPDCCTPCVVSNKLTFITPNEIEVICNSCSCLSHVQFNSAIKTPSRMQGGSKLNNPSLVNSTCYRWTCVLFLHLSIIVLTLMFAYFAVLWLSARVPFWLHFVGFCSFCANPFQDFTILV